MTVFSLFFVEIFHINLFINQSTYNATISFDNYSVVAKDRVLSTKSCLCIRIYIYSTTDNVGFKYGNKCCRLLS